MNVEVIEPHGFCGGVERAVTMARTALVENPLPIYCLHDIVHNESVVQGLARSGMRFVEDIGDVPEGAMMLVSAHGTSPVIREEAETRHLRLLDATCPFVAAAHNRIRKNHARGMRTAIVGDPSHAEVRGYLGEPGACLPEDVEPGEVTGLVVQTTIDAGAHEGVCTATRDRQNAVKSFVMAHRDEANVGVVVVGSPKSANTGRLAEIAERAGARVWRIGAAEDVKAFDFSGIDVMGVTSGASTPEEQFRSALAELLKLAMA